MNFKNGTALAKQQDEYLKRYLNGGFFSKKEINEMENNLWVKTAYKLAPSNLVVRHYALIDLMIKSPQHVEQILNQMKTLTYNSKSELKLWAEGYSYYNYTNDVLDEWCKLFSRVAYESGINNLKYQIDKGFIATAYKKKGVLYPALFGDLRNEPLCPYLQVDRTPKSITINNVEMHYEELTQTYIYIVKGKPIGFNTHIPKDNSISSVVFGEVTGFKFYEGYDKKYKNKLEELIDTFIR